MTHLRLQTPADHGAVETLLDAAFGTTRKAKSAYALRAGVPSIAALSFVAVQDGDILGCIRFTPVAVDPLAGSAAMTGLLLLGPLAVEPAHHGVGIGQSLVDHGLAAAAALEYQAAILVGDPEYYGRFGFDHSLVSGIVIPAEADQTRVQGHEITPGSFDGISGTLVPFTPPGSGQTAQN